MATYKVPSSINASLYLTINGWVDTSIRAFLFPYLRAYKKIVIKWLCVCALYSIYRKV